MADNSRSTQASGQALYNKRRSIGLPALREKVRKGKDVGSGKALVKLDRGTTAVLIGLDHVEDWDDEELRRGRRRDANGLFTGRNPQVVAKAVHDEQVRRTLATANQLLLENTEAAVKVLADIMKDTKADNKDRLTAIKMITDRAMGKEPINVNIGQEAKWQVAITQSIVSMPAALVDPDINNRDEGEEDDDPAGD